ncbi:MAG TPA: Flp pilus assembly protein CpaB [Bacillales bacterium]|nr:Flp pilus assembly protein CpaB [Bacillales bacterium]
MKSKLILVLAIVMAGFTTYLFYRYMQHLDTGQASDGNTVNVVVAKEAIKKNERITKEKLTIVQYPETRELESMTPKFDAVAGLYATVDMAAGEPVLTNHVRSHLDENVFVSRKITPGFRAVSVGVDYVRSVSNLIEPEDKVDVVVSITTQVNQKKQTKTETLVSNVRVLAVGSTMIEPDSKDGRTKYEAVTLELKPEDALKVIRAAEQGKLQLILNSRLLPNEGGNNDGGS